MSARKLAFFDALPPYLGGKRKLVAGIFKHLPGPDEAPVLADAFLGGGSVSLYAKARGYQVRCNDIAQRSVIVGQALIANDRVRLAREDVVRLFAPAATNAHFVESSLAPDIVTVRHARFLDNALGVANAVSEPKRALLRLLIVRYLYGQRPMGNFGAKTVVHQAEAGDFDAINPSFLKHMVQKCVAAHPRTLCDSIAESINRGVFAGAGPCFVRVGDAAEFLRGVDADIAVMDPPYPGTSDYGKALLPIDEMLAGHSVDPGSNPYSGAGWSDAVDSLFEAASRIPIWAITFGNAGGKGVSLEDLTRMVARHRPVRLSQATGYTHLTGLSSAASAAANEEHLAIAERAR